MYKTRLSYCPKVCVSTHCCATCLNYGGGIELIPTRIDITCKARADDDVILVLDGYPLISFGSCHTLARIEDDHFSPVGPAAPQVTIAGYHPLRVAAGF